MPCGTSSTKDSTDLDEDMTIPLIVSGPSIRGPQIIEGDVQITDIAPTIMRFFKIDAPDEWIGKSILF